MTYVHTSSPYPSTEDVVCAICGTPHQAGQLVRRRVTNTDGPVFDVDYLCQDTCEAPKAQGVVDERLNSLRRANHDLTEISRAQRRTVTQLTEDKQAIQSRYDELHADYKQSAKDRDELQIRERRYKDAITALEFELEQTRQLYRDVRGVNDHLSAQLNIKEANTETELATCRRELADAHEDVRHLNAEREQFLLKMKVAIDTLS